MSQTDANSAEVRLSIMREAVDCALAGIEAIAEMGCFANLPAAEEDKRVHIMGARILDMIESHLKQEVARVGPV
jgi:hypothetical protein